MTDSMGVAFENRNFQKELDILTAKLEQEGVVTGSRMQKRRRHCFCIAAVPHAAATVLNIYHDSLKLLFFIIILIFHRQRNIRKE